MAKTETTSTPLRLKELSKKEDLFCHGHRMCSGCGAPILVKMILMSTDYPLVASNATGCLEVSTCISDYTAWKIPWIHSAFENSAATITGVEAMYRALRKQGKIDREIKFIAFGGDGGTYDIGLQSLSGAAERGHDFTYVCYNNGAYMNTGIQRSSATPRGANTTTSPVGSVVPGKLQPRKDLTRIMVAHNIPYAAQASPSHYLDLMRKARKAIETQGPAFLNVISACNRGWRSQTNDAIALSRLAVETGYWPLYEVENGAVKVTYRPKEKRPLEEFLKPQGRFRHLFAPENREILGLLKSDVDREWQRLLAESADSKGSSEESE